jgi:hypothetical protein
MNFYNNVVRRPEVLANKPGGDERLNYFDVRKKLTCIRALIKNRGFPNEAAPISKMSRDEASGRTSDSTADGTCQH